MFRLVGRALAVAFAGTVLVVSCPDCTDPAGDPECQPGFAACDGSSDLCDVDLGASADNCGSCGHACPANPNAVAGCKEGLCANVCRPGFGDCDHDPTNGCELPTSADVDNCGACGKRCPANTECSGGVCRAHCTTGLGDCDGSIENGCETVLSSSTPNCGACGKSCGAGLTCVDTKCVTAPSCASLVGRTPLLPNGVYRIEGPEGSFDAFCVLDPAADGGGWALAAKIDGTKSTFAYGSTAWTDVNSINPTSLALDLDEAKLDAFTHVSATQARIGMREGSGPTHWLVIDTPATLSNTQLKLNDGFLNGAIFKTTVGRDAWLSLMTTPSVEADCNLEGWNVKAGAAAVRIGIMFGSSACASASFLGIGSKQLSVVAGTANGATTRPVMAYILVR